MPVERLLTLLQNLWHLLLQEACSHNIKNVEEAGMITGLREEFLIIGVDEADDNLILSLRAIQYNLAWESCRQLQAEDVVVKGKRLTAEELPLKFVEVDEEQSRLVLSNRNAMADSQAQLGIGSVFTGTVQSLRPYDTFIDIGGINGLLHFCQISHDRVTDIATVFQPGDTLKENLLQVMGYILRFTVMVEDMAQTFRQKF